jgi:pilus assembly protein Flp/PilA
MVTHQVNELNLICWSVERKMTKFIRDESGATAIEYGLIASFMAVCLVAALPLLTTALNGKFSFIGTKITSGK